MYLQTATVIGVLLSGAALTDLMSTSPCNFIWAVAESTPRRMKSAWPDEVLTYWTSSVEAALDSGVSAPLSALGGKYFARMARMWVSKYFSQSSVGPHTSCQLSRSLVWIKPCRRHQPSSQIASAIPCAPLTLF